ncbi:MAG: RtcB family protein [Planctomycetaceae bacterium]
MNARQLEKFGIPRAASNAAIIAIQQLIQSGTVRRRDIKQKLRQIAVSPELFLGDPILDALAKELRQIEGPYDGPLPTGDVPEYKVWGSQIDQAAHHQMDNACHLPGVVAAALMPDAHVGYGLPIGGVLAVRNAVIPYAVGVDIACRMKLSVLDIPVETMEKRPEHFRNALLNGTHFGMGVSRPKPTSHPVMDEDWTVTRVTRENKDRARRQLGTSGSGNHFVEFGVLSVTEYTEDLQLAPGRYTALMSHSGSRGSGASVCSTYSNIARRKLDKRWQHVDRLAWLEMDSDAGQEYWSAMNLMGKYASACHDVIHRTVTSLLGARTMSAVENHHNFAWIEEHQGETVVVHRKGATPAGDGVLGVIPGSMADPAFVVRGKGNSESLQSAAHGAGRRMSRRQATNKYNFRAVQKSLAARGIEILSAGADEVPMVYKNIEQVMADQSDLVESIARFDPRIVRMCGDGSRAED